LHIAAGPAQQVAGRSLTATHWSSGLQQRLVPFAPEKAEILATGVTVVVCRTGPYTLGSEAGGGHRWPRWLHARQIDCCSPAGDAEHATA
jgi:hypothetical protein